MQILKASFRRKQNAALVRGLWRFFKRVRRAKESYYFIIRHTPRVCFLWSANSMSYRKFKTLCHRARISVTLFDRQMGVCMCVFLLSLLHSTKHTNWNTLAEELILHVPHLDASDSCFWHFQFIAVFHSCLGYQDRYNSFLSLYTVLLIEDKFPHTCIERVVTK